MGWSRAFDDAIPHPDGGTLATLEAAGHYILAALTKREAAADHWQLALRCLIDAAEDRGPLMHAHIAMLRALNHGAPPRQAPRKKRARTFRIVS